MSSSVHRGRCWIRLAVLLGLSTVAAPALALTINLDSIAAQSGSGFTLRDRFGLVPAVVGSALVTHIINIDDCLYYESQKTPLVDFTWSWTDKPLTQLTPQFGIKIAAPGKSCDPNNMIEATTSTTGCKTLYQSANFSDSVTARGQITTIDLHDLLDGVNCNGNADADANVYFILNTNTTTGGTAASGIALNIHLGLARPNAPAITSISSGDGNLKVNWSAPSGTTTTATTRYRVYWNKTDFSGTAIPSSASHSDALTSTNYQVTGLTNGVSYYVAVVAMDSNDNESAGSETRTAIPIPTQDMWQYYKAQGGAEDGGYGACSAGTRGNSSGVALLVAAAGLLLLVGRRRRTLSLVVLLLIVGSSLSPATAQAASPLTMSAEFRAASYTPNIDREFASTTGATPYADIMGSGAWQFGLALDWRTLAGYWGDLSFGFSLARWTKDGQARSVSGAATSDTTALNVLPITIDAVYHFTTLADQWKFPLVPYAKVGAAYSLWWMENGVGNISRYTSSSGATQLARGGTGGLCGSVGLRLLLDVFEPQAARSFDIEMGVNHSYLFAEYQMLNLVDFGNKKSLDLSANIFVFGLAFDL